MGCPVSESQSLLHSSYLLGSGATLAQFPPLIFMEDSLVHEVSPRLPSPNKIVTSRKSLELRKHLLRSRVGEDPGSGI